MDDAERRQVLLKQEAIAATVVNAMISIGFFFLIFGWSPAPARALGIDFLPQSAGVTFLGGVVPSLITYGRIARGKVVPAGPVPSNARQLLRVLIAATVAVVVFGGAAALLTLWLAPAEVAPLPALMVKAVYGGALGRIMTPPLIRSVLGMPMFATGTTAPAAAAQ